MKKKALVLMLVFAVGLACVSWAVHVPSPGIKTHGTLAEMYGKIGFDDNGNKFRFVLNSSGTNEYGGHPAFYARAQSNDYTVGRYLSTSSLESFAGIWHCNDVGSTTIANGYYGWIQISGTRTAYVTTEGTSIAVGDVLIGSVEASSTDTAGQSFLTRGRAAVTSSATPGAYATFDWPKAKQAYTHVAGNTSALKRIELRSEY